MSGKRAGGDCNRVEGSLRKSSLLTVDIFVNKTKHVALIDTGSTVSLIAKKCVHSESVFAQNIDLLLIDGSTVNCKNFVVLNDCFLNSGKLVSELKCFIVDNLPSNIDLILGMDSIFLLNLLQLNSDVKIVPNSPKNFSGIGSEVQRAIEITDKDFHARLIDKV